jgi:hypothetical protein
MEDEPNLRMLVMKKAAAGEPPLRKNISSRVSFMFEFT